MAVRRRKRRTRKAEKRVDETLHLSGPRRGAILKEEVWYEEGSVVKYSLAYINPRRSSADHGRILGYDNSHGHHHRHFMGQISSFAFESYERLVSQFEHEVHALWRQEDEENREE